MTIQDLVDYLDAAVLCGEDMLAQPVHSACGSDLMSDVLAFVKDRTVLITGLTNTHVIRTAEMLDIGCIVFSRGKKPGEDMLEMAREQGICMLSTKHTTYVTCGILYKKGLPGTDRIV
ncbi:MAG: DRTGG domain-containing protein [Bacillota bacterium]|nr:DRTGG domain-containing protein [Bacillota bacterium]